MYRESMNENHGMLFLFEELDEHAIWMRNVEVPLDIIWIDENRRIQHIYSEAPPCLDLPCPTYKSPLNSLYVLELKGGSVTRSNIQVGQKLYFNASLSQLIEKKLEN